MAPEPDFSYFPTLDWCLDGGIQLFSWKATFVELSSLSPASKQGRLRRHLTDRETIKALSSWLSPYPKPTKESKAAFETRTSAINVTPTAPRRYNFEEIKGDALWLSQTLEIDETSSLRIVILEWQSRALSEILEVPTLLDPSVLFLNNGNGNSNQALSARNLTTFEGADSSRMRCVRLILLYLSERRYLLRVFNFISFHGGYETSAREGIDPSSLKDDENWVERLYHDVSQAFRERQTHKQDRVNPYHHAIAALEDRARSIPRRDGFIKDGESEVDLEIAWNTNQILEMIHIMQILIFCNEAAQLVTPSNYIVKWFKFISECKFFEQTDLSTFGVDPAYTVPLRANVALLSLSILQINPALRLLEESSSSPHSAADSTDVAPYLLNPVAICEINEILLDAADMEYISASPAVFAWSIILQRLREFANVSRETRELKQSERSASTYISANGSVGDNEEFSIDRQRPSLQRRVSAGSDTSQQSTYLEDILEKVTNVPIVPTSEDPIETLAKSATDRTHVLDIILGLAVDFCGPFGAGHRGKVGMKLRLVLLSLLRAASDYIDYDVQLLAPILAVLTSPSRYHDIPEQHKQHRDAEPCAVFLNDAFLMRKIFDIALYRFPHEILTFLKLSRALGACKSPLNEGTKPLRSILEEMETYTCAMPAGVEIREQWETDETDDSPFCELATDFDVFQSGLGFSKNFTRLMDNNKLGPISSSGRSNMFLIPGGTKGRVLANGSSFVILWYHQYSGLKYLGRRLEEAYMTKDRYREDTGGTAIEVASEIIGLFTMMLASSTGLEEIEEGARPDVRNALSILDHASSCLSGDQDIVTVIFGIFEEELHKQQLQQCGEPASELLVQCLHFTRALLHIVPGRVWPFLGRSSLLGLDGKESQLSAIVTGVEMAAGQYGFLLGCIRLFDALVEDALVNVVPRKNPRPATRFEEQKPPIGTGVSDFIMKKILLAFERVVVDVFETNRNWKFASQDESLEINTRVCLTLDKVLRYSFEVDDNPNLSKKLTASLAPAAENLVEVFLSRSAGDLPVQPLLHLFLEGLATPQDELSTELLESWRAQTKAVLNFSCTLVRLARYLNRPPGRLEELLFDSAPTLVKLYAVQESYKLPAIELLEKLVYSISLQQGKPQSLLTRLGENTAKNFIETLSVLDQPGNNALLATAIWKFLTTVVSRRQQWFAVYLLTGDTPRASFRSKSYSSTAETSSTRPIVQLALERLVEIERPQPDEAVNMLEFVTATADCWPEVMADLRRTNQDLLYAFADYVASEDSWKQRGPQETGADAVRKQVVSLVLGFLAIFINFERLKGKGDLFAKKLNSKLELLLSNAVRAPDYNISLHGHLRNGFESRFPSCQLLSFKRTLLNQWKLGDDYYYSIERARKLLGNDDGWAGKGKQSFEEEFRRANINLSAVEAQVMLLKNWSPLIMEMSLSLNKDAEFHNKLARVVRECLEANQNSMLPETVFTRIAQTRADLAFTLSQRIIEISPSADEAKSILLPAWQTLHAHAPNIGPALASEDADYDRTLLKILYVALQPHTQTSVDRKAFKANKTKTSPLSNLTNMNTILEIIKFVAAEGFRSLTTLLHEDPTKILPIDFALITAILRTCLHIPHIADHSVHLVTQFSDDRTTQYASTLLSWADQLTINNNDPIYGEISILYLLELSVIPALAESIAVDGILDQIATTKLMGYFSREGGIGPFEEPVRMHAIWSKGILPLTLNLLKAIGAPIVGEVVAFLNAFSPQITRSLQNLLVAGSSNSNSTPLTNSRNNPAIGYITLNIASEMQSLALLCTIIDAFREAGSSVGINVNEVPALKMDKGQMREDLMALLQRRNVLSECIVATCEREEVLGRQEAAGRKGNNKQSGSGAESRLEERIVDELGGALAVLGGGEGLVI
ncbi:MAG: hypothetical protein MMC33_001421 [Icmadophila ericetorum]|nr:hypothetical protein [Icmadophila ericetorum]